MSSVALAPGDVLDDVAPSLIDTESGSVGNVGGKGTAELFAYHAHLAGRLMVLLSEADSHWDQNRPAAKALIGRALSIVEAERHARRPHVEQPLRPLKGGLSPWHARRVQRHIDAHISQPIHIEDLAASVSLCTRHFSLAFKQSFGRTPHAFIVRRRIEKAQEMMTLTTEPLAQIAMACGFADQSHLSKWFRRLTGATPRVWRSWQSVQPEAMSAA